MNNKLTVTTMLSIVILAACSPFGKNPVLTLAPGLVTSDPLATATATPFLPDESITTDSYSSLTPEFFSTATPGMKIFISDAAPPSIRGEAEKWGMTVTDQVDTADALLLVNPEPGNSYLAMYAVVAPFPTITDAISSSDLRNAWAGTPFGEFTGHAMMMDQSTYEAMRIMLGEPAAGAVRIVPGDELLDSAWAERPVLAIVPFEELHPKWKVLELDGQSPLRKEFDPSTYPLRLNFTCEGVCGLLPQSNRDPSKITTLIMTGTTALVRATAYRMELNGLTYPARDIAPILRSADVLHITNEISFADDCPYPDPGGGNLQFCSDPKYITLLEDIGTDVVELTGNHVNDWGTQWLGKSIDMYRDRGWGVFGGGINIETAKKPFLIENHGNKLAFIGCNVPGPEKAWATGTSPGAAPCEDYSWIYDEISNLRDQGYIPLTTLQYNEYYQLPPSESQARDFENIAKTGAAIVSGSQSHFPQGFAFEGDTYIHYGPGNLFFDQMDYPVVGTRRAAIDRYTIYDGRIIGVELITTMLEDWSRPRFMSPEERRQFLADLFLASGW
jgi:Bacterial capsule synthesis protein PGA_cap